MKINNNKHIDWECYKERLSTPVEALIPLSLYVILF